MTSPAEPGLVDTNILIYAVDADAPQHAAARALLDAGREGLVTLYVTSQIVCEFYSVVTNARRVAKPRTPVEALQAQSYLLSFLRVLPVPPDAVGTLLELLRQKPVVGGEVFDLQIIAAMRANGHRRIYTFNGPDFAGFSDLTVTPP